MWLKIHIFHRRAESWQVKWPMYKQFSAEGKLSFNSEQAGQEEAGVQHRISVIQFRKSKAPLSHTRENLPLAWKYSCHEEVCYFFLFALSHCLEYATPCEAHLSCILQFGFIHLTNWLLKLASQMVLCVFPVATKKITQVAHLLSLQSLNAKRPL